MQTDITDPSDDVNAIRSLMHRRVKGWNPSAELRQKVIDTAERGMDLGDPDTAISAAGIVLKMIDQDIAIAKLEDGENTAGKSEPTVVVILPPNGTEVRKPMDVLEVNQ